jgi:hypothetical protein
MKYLQTPFSKFLIFFLASFYSIGATAQSDLKRADSLFQIKQYTQSLEIYQSLLSAKKYSPAMLLKMAYINEGLGKPSESLYYLKLYQLATTDNQAQKKTEELAAKYNMTGYTQNETDQTAHWVSKNSNVIRLSFALILFLSVVSIFFLKRKEKKVWGALTVLIIAASALFYLNNLHASSYVIVSNDRTYLMNGPSAGASVTAIVGEGNLIKLLGEEDVWLKVQWSGETAFVKKSAVKEIAL